MTINKQNEIYELIGYVKVSNARFQTMQTLGNELKIPSEIAKETNMRTTQISNALADLKKQKLVKCLNESAKKGRLYQNTELGLNVLKHL